jgi:hypothetical protein
MILNDVLIAVSGVVAVASAGTLAVCVKRLWGVPEEGGSEWASALADELPTLAVTRRPPAAQRLTLARSVALEERAIAMRTAVSLGTAAAAPIEHVHVGATEDAPEDGAIGTLRGVLPSPDLLTFAEQVAGADDDWAGFDRALIEYENALLQRQTWMSGPLESTQQRIDRWLSEGGRGVEHARSEARQAISETWDAPSREMPLIERPDAERVAEAALTA